MNRLSRSPIALSALLLATLHFLMIAGLGLSRHWGHLNSINDLGIFDQAVWGILHGAPFLNTNNPFGEPINWLGYHFNPILLVFAPFYLVYPAAEWLILFQAAAISITAWPLYLIGKDIFQSERAALLWVVVYLVNPFVLSAAAWDFHPVSLAAPFMALGALAILKRDPRKLGVACFFLLLTQEHYGIAVAGFGILWWLRNRSLAPAVAAVCAGIAHSVLVFGVIMPALSPTGGHIMISGDLGQLSRYGWLGKSVLDVLQNAISNPLIVLKTVFVELNGAKYLGFLLLPLLATPLVGIEFLLPGLADLLANLLSGNPMPRSLVAYHSVALLPLLVVAGMQGSARILAKWRMSKFGLGPAIVWASLLFGYLAAPLSLPYALNYWQPVAWPNMPEAEVSEIRALIPPEISLSVQGNIGAHFSRRYRIYPFPTKVGEVDAVVLRLASPTLRTAVGNPQVIGSLGHHLLATPEAYLDAAGHLLNGTEFSVVYWSPPWLVFSRSGNAKPELGQSAQRYLEQLRKRWHAEHTFPSGNEP